MEHQPQMQFVVTGNDPDAAIAVATATGGTAYVDQRPAGDSVFRTLVRATTDNPELLGPAAGVGRYVIVARTMRARPHHLCAGAPRPGVVALFPMVRRPDLAHRDSDAHWRDTHAPLALRHHIGMAHYLQLSVVHTLAGFPYDGFALCGFGSDADLKERFFDGPEGREAITADVAKFADTQNSPRRLLTTEWQF